MAKKTMTDASIDVIKMFIDPEDSTLNMKVTFVGYEENTWRKHVNAIVAKVKALLKV